jgi:hypothetical protein
MDVRILGGRCTGPAGASEGDDRGMRKGNRFDLLEKLEVLRVGTRPSPFDVVDAQLIQLFSNAEFVLNGERNIFRLGTVAESGIVEFDGSDFTQNNITPFWRIRKFGMMEDRSIGILYPNPLFQHSIISLLFLRNRWFVQLKDIVEGPDGQFGIFGVNDARDLDL